MLLPALNTFMVLRLIGSPRSRSMRTLWMLSELGLEYGYDPIEWSDATLKTDAFLAINPAGAVPTLIDDGFALSESLAINLYLAKKYGAAPFYPTDIAGEAEAWRWTLWAQWALEPWVQRHAFMAALHERAGDLMDVRTQDAIAVLERALEQRQWLCSDESNIADFNVACVLSPSRAANVDFTTSPHARDWLTLCYARSAAVATRERYG
jgi:glutathione S-transferase